MDRPKHTRSYNERLFSSDIRGYFHLARFHWVRGTVHRLNIHPKAVLELGCHDGRLLSYISPSRYVGMDANWLHGLERAQRNFASVPGVSFVIVRRPADINLGGEVFDLAVSLETLEHIDDAEVEEYLRTIADHLDGHFLVSVPNEKGPLLLLKWIVKRVLRDSKESKAYTWRELFCASIGRLDKVERLKYEHKGFDYARLIDMLRKHFEIVSVEGRPFGFLPVWMCFSVCIVAKKKGVHQTPVSCHQSQLEASTALRK